MLSNTQRLIQFIGTAVKQKSILAFLLLLNSGMLFSQGFKVSGTIIDKNDNQPVIGAFVYLTDENDSTDRIASTTDVNGKFMLGGMKKKNYKLTIQSMNYERITKEITLTKSVTDLGIISLSIESRILKEVVITGQGTAVQKGDTTVMTADAFKVNQDANAEDLVKKMPGITVENGTVKARGEAVDKVLVDGKPFFGDDPSVALRNLPAEVIDKIQVYNKLSDQAELTGFDDGESSRTINIITRKSNKYSSFGKITAGTDFSDKYLVGGSINLFSGPRRFTISGMTNNINQQNFAMQDLIGASSGGSGRGWGGRNFGGSGGISKNSSAGFNYQDTWGKKLSVSGSYFFNTTTNTVINNSNTVYAISSENGKYATDSSRTVSTNYNHRFNMRLEYIIDSMNSIIIVPRASWQNNESEKQSGGLITGGTVHSTSLSFYNTDASGYNLGNDITWRHRFLKKGRTLSVRSSVNYDDRKSNIVQNAWVDSIPDNQFSDIKTHNLTINTNLNYTEPIGKNSQLQVNFNNRYRKGENNNEIFAVGDESERLGRIDSLSNLYDNTYITNRLGLSYLYKKDKLNFSAGLNYELSDLNGTQRFPQYARVNKSFRNVLPNLMINYKFSDITNLRIIYRAYSEAPSITDFQTAIDNSDRFRITTGNPRLKESYSHNIMSNFSYANPTSGFNAFVFMRGTYSNDIIANKTLRAEGDTLYQPDNINVNLIPGAQLTYPVNLDNMWNVNSMVNLSYFVKPIKSNVSLVTGVGYSESPEYVQNIINTQHAWNLTNSLIITSNISQNIDFTLSYTSNFNNAGNSKSSMEDETYWYQSASGKLNLIFWKGFTFNTDVVGQVNRIDQGKTEDYTEKYMVWNASLGKKFLKNKAAEIKIGAYDILDQNRSFYHTVTPAYTRDSWTKSYKRYFLILFSYNLRANRGQGNPEQPKQDQSDRNPVYPGGPPPGMPPGGFRPGGGPPGGYHDH